MQFPTSQSSYAAGELSPALSKRVDLAKYRVGLQQQRDFFTVVAGGSVSRPGTQFIGEVHSSPSYHRLFRFKYATGDTYVLEFGNGTMRVIRNGAYVESSPSVPYVLATPYSSGDLPYMRINQSFDKVIITHRDYRVDELTRSGHAAWSLSYKTFAPQTAAPSWTSGTPTSPGAASYSYAITSINAETGEESLASYITVTGSAVLSSTDFIDLLWSAGGGTRTNVYRNYNGAYGFIGLGEAGVNFRDENIEPDTSISPPAARAPLTAVNNRPLCSAFWAQRAVYACTYVSPQTVYTSVAGALDNMSVSQPTQDDDAITRTLNSREQNAIKNMVSLDDLLLFTSGGVWRGTANGQAVTPATLEFFQQTYDPISDLAPIVVGEDVLFNHELGAPVYRVSFEAVSTRWRPAELSVLSRHFFDGYTLVDWCYAAVPYNLVWAVRSDGKLLSFTYLKEQEVYAWSLHDVGGVVESICSLPESGEDAVYMIVRRVINGSTVRYVERFHTRRFTSLADGWFLDCGLRYSGAPATIISGLGHLEGEEVVVLADGVVVRGLTVTSGAITLATAASVVLVGKGYTPTMRTCGVENQPTIQGKLRKPTRVTLGLLDTRGGQVGPALNAMTNIRLYEQLGDPGSATELFTGDAPEPIENSWDDGGAIYITQPDPYPMTVLAHTLEMSVG